jgi:hypothetical protein
MRGSIAAFTAVAAHGAPICGNRGALPSDDHTADECPKCDLGGGVPHR